MFVKSNGLMRPHMSVATLVPHASIPAPWK